MNNVIQVNASTPYQIIISKGILSQTGEQLAILGGKYLRLAVISDSNVSELYATTVIDSLKKTGVEVHHYIFPAGEESKSMPEVLKIISWLSKHSFTRSDALIALGGGVTGDLVGFVSSIYLRGCDFIQIPTTLLAAVDSSVGGKTAVNIPEGKNLVGTFWQPSLVLCDTDTFSTLSTEVFVDGVAEMIKYGCIWDEGLFLELSDPGWVELSLEKLVARCIEIKAEIVSQDERDEGLRQILNFGHTFGHAIEVLSALEISHGQGVAIGMSLVTKSLETEGNVAEGTWATLKSILELYSLPTQTTFTASEIANASLTDKKRSGNSVSLIGIEQIGKYSIIPTLTKEIRNFIERGM